MVKPSRRWCCGLAGGGRAGGAHPGPGPQVRDSLNDLCVEVNEYAMFAGTLYVIHNNLVQNNTCIVQKNRLALTCPGVSVAQGRQNRRDFPCCQSSGDLQRRHLLPYPDHKEFYFLMNTSTASGVEGILAPSDTAKQPFLISVYRRRSVHSV